MKITEESLPFPCFLPFNWVAILFVMITADKDCGLIDKNYPGLRDLMNTTRVSASDYITVSDMSNLQLDLQNLVRPNILNLIPYRCARDDYSEGNRFFFLRFEILLKWANHMAISKYVSAFWNRKKVATALDGN